MLLSGKHIALLRITRYASLEYVRGELLKLGRGRVKQKNQKERWWETGSAVKRSRV